MTKILKCNVIKITSLILCIILPFICLVAIFFNKFDNLILEFFIKNIYNFLWCGLYGCILTCLIFKTRWIKIMVVIANLLPFVFLAYGALMGGISGPFILLLKAVIPFIPL